MLGRAWSWAKEHPYLSGAIGVLAIVLIYLLFFRRSAPAATAGTDMSGYYNALAATTSSGNELAAAQSALTAQTAQTQIGADAATAAAQAARDVQLAGFNASTMIANVQADTINRQTAGAVTLGLASTQAGLALGRTQAVETTNQVALMGDTAQSINFTNAAVALQTAAFPYGQGVTGLPPAALAANYGGGSISAFLAQLRGTSASGSAGGGNVTNGPPAGNDNSIVKAYGYDPRTFNSYG